jgi:hypothetical protein
MSYNVIPTQRFKKEAKRLAKRYHSLKADLTELNRVLAENPITGTSLGGNIYKVRLAIKSKGKGKSGGARVITYIITENKDVWLLTIYDKAELDSIDDKTLKKIVSELKK